MKAIWLRRLGKNGIGGLLLAIIGASVVVKASAYPLGTVNRMGAGFMPVVYGILVTLVGIALLAATLGRRVADTGTPLPDMRAAICIIGGLVAFVTVGASLGLVPATFLSVFIAALGDRGNSPRDAAVLAGVLVIVATVVFGYGLGLQLPLFRWF